MCEVGTQGRTYRVSRHSHSHYWGCGRSGEGFLRGKGGPSRGREVRACWIRTPTPIAHWAGRATAACGECGALVHLLRLGGRQSVAVGDVTDARSDRVVVCGGLHP